MCGLFGVIQRPESPALDVPRARTARDVLTHRGPDQAGEWHADPGVYVGHRRLSILDTSTAGQQPMTAGRVVATVNGEIYNFRALRLELEQAGFEFQSNSDSEVVLHGYRHWGADGLASRLDGMYAVVIYDGDGGKLIAFRDRVGIKPLYYYQGNGLFVWASEPKAIKAYVPAEGLTLDPEAILDFLVYRYMPAPKSAYRELRKLPPACILECQLADLDLRSRRYWQLPTGQADLSHTALTEQLRHLLNTSVRDQLVSDVPLGLLLSGGIDSSAIAAMASQHVPHIQSFSIGFREPGRDETPFAKAMAEHAGTSHRLQYFEHEDMTNLAERMEAWFDEPFSDTSAVPTYRVCTFAQERVKVALSGDGGDELFGGYRWYDNFATAVRRQRGMPLRAARGLRLPSWLPRREYLELLSIGDPLWLYARIRGSVSHARLCQWRERLAVPADYDPLWAYRAAHDPALPSRKAAQVMDFHTYLPDDILTKVDRVSMATSLECRPALLSQALVEFAFSLPENFTYLGGQLKGGFKAAIADLLPETVLEHGKQGFSVPDFGWRNELIEKSGSVQEGLAENYLNAMRQR